MRLLTARGRRRKLPVDDWPGWGIGDAVRVARSAPATSPPRPALMNGLMSPARPPARPAAPELEPLATGEEKPLKPTTVYATTKSDQQDIGLNVRAAYGIPAVAFSYFTVFGPHQALSNPYTGVTALFARPILSKKPGVVFDDELQSRDFVHVRNVARANVLAAELDRTDGIVLKIGTRRRTTLLQLFRMLHGVFGERVPPDIVGKFGEGDIRDCFAGIGRIRSTLGFRPAIGIEEGVNDLAPWARAAVVVDRADADFNELATRALVQSL